MRTSLGLWCGLMAAVVAAAYGDQTPHCVGGTNFVQDLSNGSVIMIIDDWSNVPSVMAYRGDGDHR